MSEDGESQAKEPRRVAGGRRWLAFLGAIGLLGCGAPTPTEVIATAAEKELAQPAHRWLLLGCPECDLAVAQVPGPEDQLIITPTRSREVDNVDQVVVELQFDGGSVSWGGTWQLPDRSGNFKTTHVQSISAKRLFQVTATSSLFCVDYRRCNAEPPPARVFHDAEIEAELPTVAGGIGRVNGDIFVGRADGSLAQLSGDPSDGWRVDTVFVHPERSVQRVFDRCDLDGNGVDDLVVTWSDKYRGNAFTTRWPDGDLDQPWHETDGSGSPGRLGIRRAPVCLPDLDGDDMGEISNAGRVPNTTTLVVDVLDHGGERLLVVADMATLSSTFRAMSPGGETRLCVKAPPMVRKWQDLVIIDSEEGAQAWVFVYRGNSSEHRELVALGPDVLAWIAEQDECVELARTVPLKFVDEGGS